MSTLNEIFARIDPGNERKLIEIQAFYKNDQPDGVGVVLSSAPDDPTDYTDTLKTITDNYDAKYAEAQQQSEVPALVADLREQLKDLGAKTRGKMPMPEAWLAIGNIYLLARHHFIASDKFNGVLLHYVIGRKLVVLELEHAFEDLVTMDAPLSTKLN